MLLVSCPWCGERDLSEFSYGGEAHRPRPEWRPDDTDEEWARFLFVRGNVKGVFAERWNHAAGCRRWFNALRNTATDQMLATYKIGEKRPDVDVDGPATPAGEAHGSGNDAVKVLRGDELLDGFDASGKLPSDEARVENAGGSR